MKDQIDSLLDSGIPAGRLDSTMSHPERNEMYNRLRARQLKLLYVSPERLLMQGFLNFLKDRGISSVAIDEAHCVSMWGHDFRPEYRKLSILRDALPGVPISAYTATATEHVRRDIAEQLRLDRPEILVGNSTKILSSIIRQGERFGADYTAGVLIGSHEDRILANKHDRLSTNGLLRDLTRSAVRDWIEQLTEQECIERVGEYGVLKLTEKGRRMLKELCILLSSQDCRPFDHQSRTSLISENLLLVFPEACSLCLIHRTGLTP